MIFCCRREMKKKIIFEANQRLIDHAHRPLDFSEISIEPERHRQFDQSFEKRLMDIFGFLIELFPYLMGLKKSPLIKQTYTVSQPSIHHRIPHFKVTTSL